MKILLFGVSSFIGRHLAFNLASLGCHVTGTYSTESKQIFELRKKLPKLNLIKLNVTISSDFNSLIDSFDVAVHTIGVSNLSKKLSLDEMLNVNVVGTKNILQFCLVNKVKKLIYLSSISVYGKINTELIDSKTSICNPAPYGFSKYVCEVLLREYKDQLPVVAIRLPGVLGNGAHSAWIPKLVSSFQENKDVEIYNPNELFNNAVHVEDLCGYISDLIMKVKWNGFVAFPIGADNKTTISEIVNNIKNYLSSTSKVKVVKSHMRSFCINSDLAKKQFSYKPKSIEEILEVYLYNA